MRWSHTFIPTLRDDPADAEAVSHKLLVRGGFIRQLAAGSYTMLPLGQKTRLKIAQVIREEMAAIGGQEMMLPTLHPAEILKQSERYDLVGDILFKLQDRRAVDMVLGFTEEEIFAMLASELFSYRQLPQIWYQMHTKFRDEPRPKSGLLRVREFTMKDSYSLDIDAPGLDVGFTKHREAYHKIFARFGMEAFDVEASSGAMGGTESVEFVVRSDAGEDWIVTCENGDYQANREKATSTLGTMDDGPAQDLERFATPGLRTIKALAEAHPELAGPENQIKSLVYFLDGKPVLVLMRGDHDLEEQKLLDAFGVGEDIRTAKPDEIQELMGAKPGSLGGVGASGIEIVADIALQNRHNMVTGANEDDWHYQGVSVNRDIEVSRWLDLRSVRSGDSCINCGGSLELWKGIEVGHIFKLGTRYSEAFGAYVQDEEGNSHPIIMGSYGIGVERAMAAIVEGSHDDKGIVWPVTVAPFQLVITVLRADDEATMAAAESLYDQLHAAGVDVLLDDRVERPGVKFADAELVGIPYRLTVGPRGLESGMLELTRRREMETSEVSATSAVEELVEIIKADLAAVGGARQ